MAEGTEEQRESLELILRAIDVAVTRAPGEITADDVRREIGDREVHWEMMGGAFNTLKQQGLLERVGTKTSQWPGMKNRRLTTYRATLAYRRQLGLVPPDEAERSQTVEILREVFGRAQKLGFVCTLTDVVNFYLCLNAKPFVILSGISGTGKTMLPSIFGRTIGAEIHHIAVKPNWTDNTDLMGYYSLAHDEYVSGPLTKAIQAASADPGHAHIVRLDEMNLAHVEHYLSDVLSIMETRRRLESGEVVTEPLPFELPFSVQSDAKKKARWAALASLALPWNLFLVGTVNIDETTHPFSRKVLDRAHAIDFSEVDLTVFSSNDSATPAPIMVPPSFLAQRPASVREVYSLASDFFDELAAELEDINNILYEAELHFGYRIRDEICLYMWAWRVHGIEKIISRDEAFDLCVKQKVLSRCHGTTEASRASLQRLFFRCLPSDEVDPMADPDAIDVAHPEAERRYPRSAAKIVRMLRRYRDTGIFSYWS